MNPADPTGRAAHACGRGLAAEPRREDAALTVREARNALRDGADAFAEMQITEAGRPTLVILSRVDLWHRLEAMDGDDSTRFYTTPDGDICLREHW